MRDRETKSRTGESVGGEPTSPIQAAEAERDRAMASLRESEERYRAICELVHDWVYAVRFEPNDKVVRLWATYNFVDICGFTSEEIDAMGGWVSVVHP